MQASLLVCCMKGSLGCHPSPGWYMGCVGRAASARVVGHRAKATHLVFKCLHFGEICPNFSEKVLAETCFILCLISACF